MTTEHYDASYYRRFANRFRPAGSSPSDRSTARWVAKHAPAHHTAIEVGSGLCVQAQRLTRYFTTVIASDISDPFVAAPSRPGVSRARASAQNLPFASGSADALLAIDTPEHLPDPNAFFADAHRVLRPQGVLVIRVPNTKSLGARHKRAAWFAYQDPTHISLWPPEAWRTALTRHGFTVLRTGTDTLWDTPYTRRAHLLQKLLAASTSRLLLAITPCLPWPYGENLILLARREN